MDLYIYKTKKNKYIYIYMLIRKLCSINYLKKEIEKILFLRFFRKLELEIWKFKIQHSELFHLFNAGFIIQL
jgi:hypothetical protein